MRQLDEGLNLHAVAAVAGRTLAMHNAAMTSNPRKIIVADDHPLFRAALQKCLTQSLGEVEIIEAGDLETLQALLHSHGDADLLLLDLHMPGAQGFSALMHVNGHYAHLPVIVISANEKPGVMRAAVECGAAGFLPKSAPVPVITEAISRVLAGEIWLPALPDGDEQANTLTSAGEPIATIVATFTPQQYRVSQMLVAGLQNKQIAIGMDITEATVKAHLTSIFRKLGVSSRTQAVLALKSVELRPQG